MAPAKKLLTGQRPGRQAEIKAEMDAYEKDYQSCRRSPRPGTIVDGAGKPCHGQSPDITRTIKPESRDGESDFSVPVATGPKVPENNAPLTGAIIVPLGCGVHEIIQGHGQPKLVGFSYVLEETKVPVTMVMSRADAWQMAEMLADLLSNMAGK